MFLRRDARVDDNHSSVLAFKSFPWRGTFEPRENLVRRTWRGIVEPSESNKVFPIAKRTSLSLGKRTS